MNFSKAFRGFFHRRRRRRQARMTLGRMGMCMFLWDSHGRNIVTFWPDGSIDVNQPDKIYLAADILIREMAAAAAAAEVEKAFKKDGKIK